MQETEPQTARLCTVQNVACSWLSYAYPIDRAVLNLCIYYPLTLRSAIKLGDHGVDRVTDYIRRGNLFQLLLSSFFNISSICTPALFSFFTQHSKA